MPLKEEKLQRIQNGERPYRDRSGNMVFKKEGEVDELDCDVETGEMLTPMPTENFLTIGLYGMCRLLHWNSISEEGLDEFYGERTLPEELRDILQCDIRDQSPHDGNTSGVVAGGIAGLVYGIKTTYEAYVDKEPVESHFPLKLDNLPIHETIIPVAGQHVLFCIEDFSKSVGTIEIPDCALDESKIQLYVDRFRFGEIYFDMVRMRYDDQVIDGSTFNKGLRGVCSSFALDANGEMVMSSGGIYIGFKDEVEYILDSRMKSNFE